MTEPHFEVVVADPAGLDISEILDRSAQEFGVAAAIRYETLIVQALLDIGQNPERPGSTVRPEIMILEARTYHLSFSRRRVIGRRVKEPSHFVLYRHLPSGVIEVARVLHDSRDLVRNLPERFRL